MEVLLGSNTNNQNREQVNQQEVQKKVGFRMISTIETGHNNKGKNHEQSEEEHHNHEYIIARFCYMLASSSFFKILSKIGVESWAIPLFHTFSM